MEDDAVGIELTPFTKKDITVSGKDEAEEQKSIQTQDEGPHGTLDDMSQLTITGQKQPEKVSK